MVGERYRDLIEAADTIAAMRKCSQKILENVENLKVLQTKGKVDSKGEKSSKIDCYQTERFNKTAATIRLLTILPDRIHTLVTSDSSYLLAAKCYLLGNFGSNYLGCNTGASGILAVLPVLNDRCAQLQTAKRFLRSEAINKISSFSVTTAEATNGLLSLALIEENDDFDFLTTFVDCRINGLKLLLSDNLNLP